MEYIFFAAYLVLFAWLVTKTRFFLKTGLSKPQLVILFLLKVIAGIFYGWMGNFYGGFAQMVDTWNYHHNGILEYQLLKEHPYDYFTNLFRDPYDKQGVESFFGSRNSYWNDLKGNVFIKIMSLFDIFSFGQYYINVIFYAFISLFGPIALYRVMVDVFPAKKFIALAAIFFVPSFFYWSSGLHKEGLIFTGIALIAFHIYFGSKEKGWQLKRWPAVLLGLFILLLLRNFVLAIMLPAVLAWLIANRWPRYGFASFCLVYLFCIIGFFTLRYADERLDFPQAVVSKQQAFIKNVGKSSVKIRELEPTLKSFVSNTPQAISLSVARPYPSDVNHLLSLAAAVETDIILFLFLLSLIFRKRGTIHSKNLFYFSIFFSVSLLLAIGFSVNNLGAIVRYRSILFPFIMVFIAMSIDWNRIGDYFKKNNNLNK